MHCQFHVVLVFTYQNLQEKLQQVQTDIKVTTVVLL